jgi:amino acid adenylation domain-containing protein
MAARAAALSRSLGDADRVAILSGRTPTAFAGVLAALTAGRTYVPLNVNFPPARNRLILELSGAGAIIVDRQGLEQLPSILTPEHPEIAIVADDAGSTPAYVHSRHPVVVPTAAPGSFQPQPENVPDGSLAYVMFTSGTTGLPKGVAVTHRNITSFITTMMDRYALTEHDRLSQMFDLTFDLSVFDMFMAWEAGACLCCPSPAELLSPSSFITSQRLTVWFSVPSVAMFIRRLTGLPRGCFPDLRWSLFCGEPLPADIAQAWAEAAEGSQVENLYGPTELTVACTGYRWQGDTSRAECVHGLVPIGEPFPGLEAIVVDSSLREVPAGADGELLVAGDQVSAGYWNDDVRTQAGYVTPPGRSGTYYRTGDVVRRPRDIGHLCYLGRVDSQIKVLGHRVELLEIEAALRDASGSDSVAAIGWPRTPSGAAAVVAYIGGQDVDGRLIRSALTAVLPSYMVPREVRAMPQLPLNANGKIDKRALETILENGG